MRHLFASGRFSGVLQAFSDHATKPASYLPVVSSRNKGTGQTENDAVNLVSLNQIKTEASWDIKYGHRNPTNAAWTPESYTEITAEN